MTDVDSKEAVVLFYLARHKDIAPGERQRLIATLHGPAQDLAEKLSTPEATQAHHSKAPLKAIKRAALTSGRVSAKKRVATKQLTA